MRRKLAALLLCLLLVFQLSPVPSGAAETVYFTAVNKNVLTLSDDTMPFWSGGYLYVPSTIFTGVGRDLGVSYYPNIARQTVLLYVDKTVYSSLVFDLNKDYAIDNEGNLYFQKPIQRGGVIFLPISLIARCFGLLYSTVEVDRGYLVWVRNPDMDMEERYFADAAKSRMDYEYNQYLRNQSAEEDIAPEETEPSTVTGQRIYLCVEAADPERVKSLLDILDRTIFTGVGRDLGVSYYPNIARQTVLLYVDKTVYSSLVFDLNKDYAIDNEGNLYFQKPIQRGGVIFLPISLIARCFGLLYSTVEVDRGYLVWVRNPDMDMEERYFADAAKSRMDYEYNQYLRNQSAEEDIAPEETEPSTVTGQRIYLCVEAADPERVKSLLDILDRYDAHAAFYCTEAFLREGGDLLRRMTATGQAIGLAVDAAADRPVTEQLETGNRLLSQAASVKTRLAWIENAGEESVSAAEAAGFCPLDPDLDRAAYPLSSTGAADTLLQRVTSRGGEVTVWLGDGANAAGLGTFLSAAEAADDRCLAMTETVS